MEIRVYKRSETTLAIKFTEFNKESIAVIKKISGRKWLPDELIWTIPYTLTTVQQLLTDFKDYRFSIELLLHDECYLFHAFNLNKCFSMNTSHVSRWDSGQKQKLKDECTA